MARWWALRTGLCMAESSARTPTVAAAKQALRAQLRAARAAMAPEERARCDAAIAAQVVASSAFAQAPVVLSYLSFGAEVETRTIIRAAWDAGKVVALPRVVGPHLLAWYRVDSFEGLVPSAYGMEEPAPDPKRAIDPVHPVSVTGHVTPDALRALNASDAPADARSLAHAFAPAEPEPVVVRALALVPGLAFDQEGYRLGYGGGFYDAFLSTFPGVSLGLCRKVALLPSLAACGVRAPHDVPVTAVISA